MVHLSILTFYFLSLSFSRYACGFAFVIPDLLRYRGKNEWKANTIMDVLSVSEKAQAFGPWLDVLSHFVKAMDR